MACFITDIYLRGLNVFVFSADYRRLTGRLILGGILLVFCASFVWAEPRVDTFVVSTTHQTIDNFSASDCWLAQTVGGWTNTAAKEGIADLLFSTTSGIGLSCWRFNLGGGIDPTITYPERTVETFEIAQDQYDWSRQAEEQWFLAAAKARNVPQFLAFVVSPPARMTRNGHTYCPNDSGTTNLKSGYEQQFAKYMVDILKHFRDNPDPALQINFNYISPVNEPQWGWWGNTQEGNRASNSDIKSWIQALYAELNNQGVNTQIAALESGSIPDMYYSRTFVDSFAGDPAVNTKMGNTISYHSYGSDDPSTLLIQNRQLLANKMAQYPDWKVWQTEYCILGAGGWGRDLTMTTALNVARVIHYDLSVANASAWQWWLGMSSHDYKDGLVYVDLDNETFVTSKILWALGNYSRFIRPGAKRIDFTGDNSTPLGLLASAYRDDTTHKISVVYVNQNTSGVEVQPTFNNATGYQTDYMTPYVTSDTAGDDLKQYAPFLVGSSYTVPARAVVTLLSGTFNENNDGKVFSALTGSAPYTLGSGVLTIDPGEGTYSGVLSGAGGIRKSGSGTTVLWGANNFVGPVYIYGGTLKVGNSSALGATDAGTTIDDGATLDVNDQNLGAESITVQGAGVGGNGAIVNSGAGQNNALRFVIMNNNTTFGGSGRWDIRTDNPNTTPASLTGNGYSLTKLGNNVIYLVNLGDTGLGDINVNEGGLGIAWATTLGDPSKTVTVASGARFSMWGLSGMNVLDKKMTLHGGTLQTSNGAGTTNTFAGEITLMPDLSGNGGILNTFPETAMTLTGNIVGTGGLTKIGAGTAILSGSNNYSGNTVVNGGTLEIAGGISAGGTSLIDVQGGTAILKTVNVSKTDLDVNTAELATFEVASGIHEIGSIAGGGITTIDDGATLSVDTIYQGGLYIGSGAIFVIRGTTGEPLGDTFAPVPEPATFALLGIGAISLLSYVRLWRKQTA